MAELCGRPLIQWILDTSAGLFTELTVVTRSAEVKALCDEKHIDAVLHSEPGRNDTVRIGLTRLMEKVDCCIFIPGDQPLVSRDTLESFLREAERGEEISG